MAIGPQETELVPTGSRVLCAGVLAVCAVVLVSLALYGRLDVLLRAAPAVGLVAVGSVVLFWLPLVRLSPGGIEVVNPLRTHRMGWGAISEVGTRWSLTLVTAQKTVTVWAAPAAGALTGGMSRSNIHLIDPVRGSDGGRDAREVATSLRRQGGTVALVARQWLAHRDEGAGRAPEPLTTTWNLPVAVTLGVLLVLTLLGALWP